MGWPRLESELDTASKREWLFTCARGLFLLEVYLSLAVSFIIVRDSGKPGDGGNRICSCSLLSRGPKPEKGYDGKVCLLPSIVISRTRAAGRGVARPVSESVPPCPFAGHPWGSRTCPKRALPCASVGLWLPAKPNGRKDVIDAIKAALLDVSTARNADRFTFSYDTRCLLSTLITARFGMYDTIKRSKRRVAWSCTVDQSIAYISVS